MVPLQFSYAVVHQVETTQDTMYLRGLDFVLEGGVYNLESNTSSNGLIIQHGIVTRLKCHLSQNHYLLTNTGVMFRGFEFFNSQIGIGIGSQITRNISSEIGSYGGYGNPYVKFLYFSNLPTLNPYIGGNVALKCDFGSHIGFDISLIGHYLFQLKFYELLPNISFRANW